MQDEYYKNEYKKLAEKLKTLRIRKGQRQGWVAARIRKSQSDVSKVEAGKLDVGAIEIAEFAKVYKKPLDFFLSV